MDARAGLGPAGLRRCGFLNNFGPVREIARDLSNSNCLLGYLRGRHFGFLQSLDPLRTITFPERGHSQVVEADTGSQGIRAESEQLRESASLGADLPEGAVQSGQQTP